MPSPFPGMDPYLEEPGLCPDFHNAMAAEIRNALNRRLPPAYYAQVEVELVVEPIELASIAIRDQRQGRKLVTLIEIVSPSNKRPGRDCDAYTKKLLATLASDSSLIEIDLLRTRERTWSRPEFTPEGSLQLPESDYLVTVSRAWQRGDRFRLEAFPIPVTESLPVISVPLRPAEEESPLDLQHCFRLAYDGGPYQRGAVDYGNPPEPPLPLNIQEWARTLAAGAMPPKEP